MRKLLIFPGLVVLVSVIVWLAGRQKEMPATDFETFVRAFYSKSLSAKPSDARRQYVSVLPTEQEIDRIYLLHRRGAKLLGAKLRREIDGKSDHDMEKEQASLRQKGDVKTVLMHDDFVRLLRAKSLIPQDLIVRSASLRLETDNVGLDAFAWVNNRWVLMPNIWDAIELDEPRKQ